MHLKVIGGHPLASLEGWKRLWNCFADYQRVILPLLVVSLTKSPMHQCRSRFQGVSRLIIKPTGCATSVALSAEYILLIILYLCLYLGRGGHSKFSFRLRLMNISCLDTQQEYRLVVNAVNRFGRFNVYSKEEKERGFSGNGFGGRRRAARTTFWRGTTRICVTFKMWRTPRGWDKRGPARPP